MSTQGNLQPDPDEYKPTHREIEHLKENEIKGKIDDVKKQLKPENLRIFQQTRQPGAFSWLNDLALSENGFNLNKNEFRDALNIRHNRHVKGLPSHCPCGQNFNLVHAMNCKRGGFIIM